MNTMNDVRRSFESWRTTRTKRGPIPDALWGEAVELMGRYPASVIAKELRLNATQLKRKSLALSLDDDEANPVHRFAETDWQAVKVLAESDTQSDDHRGHWLMVLKGPDGFRLHLESRHFDGASMKGLLRAFVG